MKTEEKMERYKRWLQSKGFADNTTASYLWVATYFERTYGEPDDKTLREYRSWLVENFKPTTASQRIQAINCYLGYIGHSELKMSGLHVQQTTFLDGVVSDEDYRHLLNHMHEGGYLRDYHAIRLMATTGARVSELLRMKLGDLRMGYADMPSKGKVRRINIPDNVAADVLVWAESEGRNEGALFLNQYGNPITARGLSYALKARAAECGVDVTLIHPHAFRHMFARNFLVAGGDIALLADLLGHSSIETTRVYLRRTATEQREVLNRLVSW